MTESSDLSSALSETLTNSDLEGITVELSEVLSDTFLEDGLIKDIPIIGTIWKLSKLGLTIKDRLFVKKLLFFISEVAHVPAKDRAEMISKIDRSGVFQIKVGEKLLYILDKSEDHENSRLVGCLFSAFLSGELSYDDFLRTSRTVQRIMDADLWQFVNDEKEWWEAWEFGDLLNTGLIEFDESEISVEDHHQDSWKDREKYDVINGEITASLTELGKKIRTILRSSRPTTDS